MVNLAENKFRISLLRRSILAKPVYCRRCNAVLKKDWIGLNKKLIDKNLKEFLCINCLADELECEIRDLEIKIEEFKEEGCTLFK